MELTRGGMVMKVFFGTRSVKCVPDCERGYTSVLGHLDDRLTGVLNLYVLVVWVEIRDA